MSSHILTITCMAFSITCMLTNSYGPWKFTPPAKMLGQGSPLNDSCAPSVPPRIGSTFGGTAAYTGKGYAGGSTAQFYLPKFIVEQYPVQKSIRQYARCVGPPIFFCPSANKAVFFGGHLKHFRMVCTTPGRICDIVLEVEQMNALMD